MNDKYWFHPKNRTGWKKTQVQTTRLRRLLESTDKRLSRRNRYLQAAQRAQALSNVTKDLETKQKAARDAAIFYRRAKALKAE